MVMLQPWRSAVTGPNNGVKAILIPVAGYRQRWPNTPLHCGRKERQRWNRLQEYASSPAQHRGCRQRRDVFCQRCLRGKGRFQRHRGQQVAAYL